MSSDLGGLRVCHGKWEDGTLLSLQSEGTLTQKSILYLTPLWHFP